MLENMERFSPVFLPGLEPVKLSVVSATVALLDILSVEKLRHEPKAFAKLSAFNTFNTIAMSMVSAVQWHNAAYTPEMGRKWLVLIFQPGLVRSSMSNPAAATISRQHAMCLWSDSNYKEKL